jgi:hypothetical protein
MAKLHVADKIFADEWLYETKSANGILGYGSQSTLMKQYIDTNGELVYTVDLLPDPNKLVFNETNQIWFGSSGNIDTYLESDKSGK